MECASTPNNGPRATPQPHMIPGYMGYVPQYKFKYGTTYGQQTNRLFLDPCVNMSPRAVLTDVCPEDCSSGGFLQSATGFRYGQCGCNDPYKCNREPQFNRGTNKGQTTETPRFQTILNHDYAPFCNRFCTKTYEQDQWRDRLLIREKQAMDGWRYCYKSKPWERPDRIRPWDGDHGEFRRTQTTDIFLRGYDGVCGCTARKRKMERREDDDFTTPPKRLRELTIIACPVLESLVAGSMIFASLAGGVYYIQRTYLDWLEHRRQNNNNNNP